ncbi:hypothetical protein E2542_SST17218 [Spatholobus suberectus]|nr:hypothetical protein E2542_SST17218 [Spatholobus suberectus]
MWRDPVSSASLNCGINRIAPRSTILLSSKGGIEKQVDPVGEDLNSHLKSCIEGCHPSTKCIAEKVFDLLKINLSQEARHPANGFPFEQGTWFSQN